MTTEAPLARVGWCSEARQRSRAQLARPRTLPNRITIWPFRPKHRFDRSPKRRIRAPATLAPAARWAAVAAGQPVGKPATA